MPKWLKWTITVAAFAVLTAVLYFVGFNESSKIWIQEMVNKTGVFGYVLYILLQVIITTIFCFIPATTFTFGLIATQIFSIPTALILSLIGCWLSSIIMFLIGRYGGVKVVDWLVGKESRIKAQDLISDRATVLVPVMLACPFFPDDAIVMVAGMTTMSFWYFLPMCLITRSIGVCTTIFLGNEDTLSYIVNALNGNIVLWFILINIILIDVYAIWKASGKIESILKKHREKKLLKKLKDNAEKLELDEPDE